MTDTLYRWVKASERRPGNKNEYPIITNMGIYDGWYDKDKDRWFTNYNETFLSAEVEWLEPLPSPGDNQSLEDREKLIKELGEAIQAIEDEKDCKHETWIQSAIKKAIDAIAHASRPSIDIVDELRRAMPVYVLHERKECEKAWKDCCDKLQELLNQSK